MFKSLMVWEWDGKPDVICRHDADHGYHDPN